MGAFNPECYTFIKLFVATLMAGVGVRGGMTSSKGLQQIFLTPEV